MRKKLLLALFMGASVWGLKAQTQVGNSNFEQWENVGSNTEEPINWNGIKTSTGGNGGLAPKSIQRSTQIRPGSTGTYSARVYSSSVIGIVANGNMTCGRVNAGSTTASSPQNYNYTQRSSTGFSEALNAWPDSIVFWVRYNNANVNQNARMSATIHDDYDYRDPSTSDANAPLHVVATAILNYPRTNGNWERKSVPFTYNGPATSPDYILITFTSNSVAGGGSAGDEVFIDDMELIYVPRTTTVSTLNPLTYNVSSSQGASISIPFTKTGIFEFSNVFTAQLSDASGSFANPVNIGTLSSNSAGTINATIPAGTPSGTGYRIRVVATTPNVSATANLDNITINLVTNSVAPSAAQTIAANTNGSTLSVTENPAAVSRVWKFATTSGGPYANVNPSQTGFSYVPNFANAGTYYVICESSFGGGLTAVSNEVVINVVKNQIAPAGTQSLLVSVAGTTLNVTETPTGTAREWFFSTTPGGPYSAFAPVETGTSYVPVFNTQGTYYVVCTSTISGVQTTSNEVIISVGNANISTGTIAGSPFEFSPSSPNANVDVPFTVSGPLNAGNVFTAQLSDANGSFANATNIGTLSSQNSGTISAVIPNTTPAGNGYLIRVISSAPAIFGSDNGTDLVVDQYNNSVSPAGNQTFVYSATGSDLTVSESQNSVSREWRISTTAGGPYTAISPAQNNPTYTPSVAQPGTYYVVCASENQWGDEVLSNEVMLTAENGNTLTTSAIAASIFYVSPSANVTTPVNFTSDIVFDAGNVFTAQLSDANGSFGSPTAIGTLAATAPATITATIPNIIFDGTGYRIRVVSSSPAAIGTDNGSDIEIIKYYAYISSTDTQTLAQNTTTSPVTASSSHPNVSYEWKFRTATIGDYFPFNPVQTGATFTWSFPNANNYQVVAQVVNQWNDTLITDTKVFAVYSTFGVNETDLNGFNGFWAEGNLYINLEQSVFSHPVMEIISMNGQVVFKNTLYGNTLHVVPVSLTPGIYTLRVSENDKVSSRKLLINR